MKRHNAQEYLNLLDTTHGTLGTQLVECISDLIYQTSEIVRLLLEGKTISHFELIDSLLTLATNNPQANAKDVMRRLFAFDKADTPKLCFDIWHCINHIQIHLHQRTMIQENLHDLKVEDRHLTGVRIAVNQICAQVVTRIIRPNFVVQIDENELSGIQQGIFDQISNEVENRQGALTIDAILESMMIGAMHVYTHRLFNKAIFSPEIRINTELAEFNLHFDRKPIIQDHSEARVRFQFVQQQTAKHLGSRYSEQEIEAVKTIQKAWREVRSIRVNTQSGAHSDLAHHMINLESNLRKSVDVLKINEFVAIMQTSQWHTHPMFQSDEFQGYAVAAMLNNKISTLQLATLLRWHAAKLASISVKTHPILAVEEIARPKSSSEKSHLLMELTKLNHALDNIMVDTELSEQGFEEAKVSEVREASEKIDQKLSAKPLISNYQRYFRQLQDKSFLTDEKFVDNFNPLMAMFAVNQNIISARYALALTRWVENVIERRSIIAEQMNALLDKIADPYQEHGAPISEAASNDLVPWLLASKGYEDERRIKPLSYKELKRFTALIALLPPSERVFYKVELADEGLPFFKGMFRIEMSQSALQAYRMVAYGNNAAKSDLRFGQFSKEHIEHAERCSMRPGSIATVDSFATTHVHGEDVPQYEADNHDDFHSAMLSMLHPKTRAAIFLAMDVLRSVSGYEWSIMIWNIVDFVFQQNKSFDNGAYDESKHSLSAIFSHIVDEDLADIFTLNNFNRPTSTLWALALDIAQAPQKWLDVGVHPNELTGQLKDCIGVINKHWQFICNDEPRLAIYKLICFHKVSESVRARFKCNEVINHAYFTDQLKLGFTRRNKHNPPLLSLTVNDKITDKLERPIECMPDIGEFSITPPKNDCVYVRLNLLGSDQVMSQIRKLLLSNRAYDAYPRMTDLLQDLAVPHLDPFLKADPQQCYPIIVKLNLPKDDVIWKQYGAKKLYQAYSTEDKPEIKAVYDLNALDVPCGDGKSSLHIASVVAKGPRKKAQMPPKSTAGNYCGLKKGFF